MIAPAKYMEESPELLLRKTILHEGNLVEASFQGFRSEPDHPWKRITIRPVLIKGERHLQFAYFNGKQEIAKNYSGQNAETRLSELLSMPYRSAIVVTTDRTIRVQFSKKGRPIIHLEQHRGTILLDMAHDRPKPGILPENQPPPFLREIGVATADGRIRASQQRKFNQINEFLRLIDETGEVEQIITRPIQVADLGCGSAALTFATYHYLSDIKNLPVVMVGVDAKAHLMERHQDTADRLHWKGMSFTTSQIIDYKPSESPDIVLALHACDTATDEALAQAVRWGSHLIFSAPCCHHHLQAQLASNNPPDPFRPVLRHGILRERLGDLLTDSFRAHILRLLGYRTDVIEFVAGEHTPKNLMIRGIRVDNPAPRVLIEEYRQLKRYWGVTPYLEELLADELDPILAA